MIHQCRCGFATNDQLWFESHQARHLLRGDGQVVRRDHDLSGLTVGELQRARRELEASLALARPGSVVSNPIMAQIRAIDAALAGPAGYQAPRCPESWRGSARRVEDDAPVSLGAGASS